MTFSEACSLKNHWRTNLGEKTFPCKECPKAFSQGGQLKIHFTKHSGEKPYPSVNVKVTFQTIKFLAFQIYEKSFMSLELKTLFKFKQKKSNGRKKYFI